MIKKIGTSLLMASLVPLIGTAKGIDIEVTGKTVLYYETNTDNGSGGAFDASGLFTEDSSEIQFGLQLGLAAYLGNGFNFNSEIQYKGTSGLDNTLGTERQAISDKSTNDSIADEIALSQMYVSKKIGNSVVKFGRQELSRAYYPFTFTEGWNVFKNTFEAFTVVNNDIPDTTIVLASVGKSNNVAPNNTTAFVSLNTTQQTSGNMNNGARNVDGSAYMVTAVNKSIPMTTVSGTWYQLSDVANTATVADDAMKLNVFWGTASLADKSLPMDLHLGLQGGVISTSGDDDGMSDTSAFGAKLAVKPSASLNLSAAFTSVSGDDDEINIAFKNFGTGIKTPLFTQMVYNQDNISLDADTLVVKASYSLGANGTIITQYGMTNAGKSNIAGGSDYAEFDLMYKVKNNGIKYFIAYVNRTWDERSSGAINAHGYLLTAHNTSVDNRIRMWARYDF